MGANSNKEQMRYILNKAEVSAVVCSSNILSELMKVLPECPAVRLIILMDAALNSDEVCSAMTFVYFNIIFFVTGFGST